MVQSIRRWWEPFRHSNLGNVTLRGMFSILLLTSLLSTVDAHALTHKDSLGDLRVTIYAPDWTWQKNAVNILVSMENVGDQPVTCSLELLLPQKHADHFLYDNRDSENSAVTVPPGATLRHAFTNIEALGDVDRQTYTFTINASTRADRLTVDYPLTTTRGPVVSGAKWATLLPVIICIIWCITFVVALTRFAKPGAWKTPGQLDLEQHDGESWIDESP